MAAYRLQAMMRFSDGRAGFTIHNIEIDANNGADAIALARDWRPEADDLVPEVLMLISPEGAVLWSLRRMEQP